MQIRKILGLMMFPLFCAMALSGCSDEETYAEQRDKERKAIAAFLTRDVAITSSEGDTLIHVGKINPISEAAFHEAGDVTNTDNNEYVILESSGVYMQIVRKGTGSKLQSGERRRVICGYTEFNILRDSVQTSNQSAYWITNPDIIDVTNSYGTFTASFNTTVNGGGCMYSYYGSTVVPAGWLVPLTYINLGRQSAQGIAKVRLIVPHTQGHQDAKQNVYPCFYEITYQEMKN